MAPMPPVGVDLTTSPEIIANPPVQSGLIKRLIMIYYYFNDIVLSKNIIARRRVLG
jgi:hypothetical protein